MVIICSKTMRSRGGSESVRKGHSGLSFLNSHYPSLTEKVNEERGEVKGGGSGGGSSHPLTEG